MNIMFCNEGACEKGLTAARPELSTAIMPPFSVPLPPRKASNGTGGGSTDFFIAKIDPTASGANSLIYIADTTTSASTFPESAPAT
jgi:hypothetical protein